MYQQRQFLLTTSLLVSLAVSSPAAAQLFDFYPDVPLNGDFNSHVYIRDVLDARGARDLQEIPDGSGRFLTMRSSNFVQIVSPGESEKPYLQAGSTSVQSTEGAVSMAIHPGFATEGSPGFGKLYTITVDKSLSGTPDFISNEPDDVMSHSVVTEWTTTDPTADEFVGTSRELMRFEQRSRFHNLNQLLFGPDNLLYIGSGEDTFLPHSHDLSSAYGKILRIDPLGSNSENGAYGIPADNPFRDHPDAAHEVYAYGLRNPWRMGFDRETGQVYGGDSGHQSIEEINLIEPGKHYGWPELEGTFVTKFSVELGDFLEGEGRPPLDQDQPNPNTGQTLAEANDYETPLFEMDRSEMNIVVGAIAYRGNRFPELQGKVIFGSWNLYHIYAGDPVTGDLEIIVDGELVKQQLDFDGDGNVGFDDRIVSFNQDMDGEIYLSGGRKVLSLFSLPDFDRSGEYDISDVDSLCSAMGTRSSQFDLDGNLVVDSTDLEMMLDYAGSLQGDIDLDGTVRFDDFVGLSNHYLEGNNTWSTGDVTCDGLTDFNDFLSLAAHFGQSHQEAVAIPEPATALPSLYLFCTLLWRRRANKRTLNSRRIR